MFSNYRVVVVADGVGWSDMFPLEAHGFDSDVSNEGLDELVAAIDVNVLHDEPSMSRVEIPVEAIRFHHDVLDYR